MSNPVAVARARLERAERRLREMSGGRLMVIGIDEPPHDAQAKRAALDELDAAQREYKHLTRVAGTRRGTSLHEHRKG